MQKLAEQANAATERALALEEQSRVLEEQAALLEGQENCSPSVRSFLTRPSTHVTIGAFQWRGSTFITPTDRSRAAILETPRDTVVI